jgi:hypothetical protein
VPRRKSAVRRFPETIRTFATAMGFQNLLQQRGGGKKAEPRSLRSIPPALPYMREALPQNTLAQDHPPKDKKA